MSAQEFFVTTAKGVEEVLAAELAELELASVQAESGGVRFRGSLRDAYRANLWLHSASRVLMPVAEFACQSPDELYSGVRAVDWCSLVTSSMTLAVECSLRDSALTHSGFVALKTKDAIVDCVRDRTGSRPSVDTKDPDLRVNVRLFRNRCTVSLDLSGTPLDRRGYRLDRHEAPLKENLAAALIGLSGWNGETPFVDPMCGTGTIAIEAALKGARVAPGLLRRGFGFQRWPGFDQKVWRQLLEEARSLKRDPLPAPIVGSDVSAPVIEMARENARRAGVAGLVEFKQHAIADLTPPPGAGTMIFNPPYGKRLGEVEELKPLYRQIGDVMKQRCTGYTAYLFTGNLELAKSVGLKASRRIVLFNGPIECRLLKYELY
ncbi:THUMP domain-containing class I SAM-dependent RNA methyltransferase [Geomesophilobacter sediminis]|uniref:RNA methyltransferase n=1 Tax=Geomesophilobacter sediminis TaxID=2798584 RepID=A0A8J7M1A3_9BACT|nr:THUMP domain-containing protein [Geomesophilobacter sediminis]MBJ6726654.1 RNA methyltransferase [Geomesophilobacter sediminis]